MATAQALIDSAAKFAGILAEGQSLEGSINADALTRFNRMIQRWENDGVDLGIGTLTAASIVYVDPSDEEAIEVNLALRLMVRYRRQIPPGLAEAGLQAFTELQAKYAKIQEMPIDVSIVRRRSYNIETDG